MGEVLGKYFPVEAEVERDQIYTCAKVIWTFKIVQGSKFLKALPSSYKLEGVNANVVNVKKLNISFQTLYALTKLSNQVKEEVEDWITDLVPKMERIVSLINNDIW